jgi:ADP-heptose:LPS heptosyltransferase/sporulation protein YlmC with PRC-barrel domain
VSGEPLLLVYRALGLGDLLTGVPALRALARAFPGHRLALATPRALAPLARLTGVVGVVADVGPLAPLPPELHGADVAVNLHGRGPQSHRVVLGAGPRRLIAFAQPEAGVDGPRWRRGEHEVARWCRLLVESGVPADPSQLDLAPPPVAPPPGAAGATLIHPGAAGAARRWPLERWAAVARAERDAGRSVVVTGGPGEEELAGALVAAAGLPAGSMLAGRTGVLELAAAVAVAARVACADTGVAHLATAMGTPSVVLFGPTPPWEWGPPPARPWHRALWAGRRGDPHAAEPDAGLLEIAPADVIAALAADELHRPRGGVDPPQMTDLQETLTWRGRELRGSDGERIGTIEEIYLDADTNEPAWALVHTGLFGTRRSFVPLRDAAADGEAVSVPFDRRSVKSAPGIDADGQLSEREEEELCRHYGMERR